MCCMWKDNDQVDARGSPKTTTKWMLDNDQVDAHIALPKFAGGSMRVQDDDGLSGELPRSVALQGDSGSHG